jgi:hypothetical protein
LAGVWAVYTFVYQQQIQPALEPPALTFECQLEKAGTVGNRTAVKATILRKNVGHRGVRVLGIAYNVIGTAQTPLDQPITNPPELLQDKIPGRFRFDRYQGPPQREELVMLGGTLFEGLEDTGLGLSELNPGESLSRDFLFYVNPRDFDAVRIHVVLIYQRQDEPPVPLAFHRDASGALTMSRKNPCINEPCSPLQNTDFSTELSLW